jgi:DegV family protein with EDD domain
VNDEIATDDTPPDARPPRGQVRIVTDSACDLPQELADHWGIVIVPLSIRFGDEELLDREQLSVEEFWSRCVTSPTLPETAAPAPGQFEAAFTQLAAEGATGIVVVSLSSALSATMQSAELAARSVATSSLAIRVVDSRTLTLGLGTIALACARLASDGASIDEVERLAGELADRTVVFGALDTLENLKKGGRIGNARALLGTALSIKPIIEVRGGVVEQAGKQRTRSKALAHLVDTLGEYEGRIENLAVLHADCSDVDAFVEMVRAHYPGDIVVGDIGPVIGTHGGRGTIGVAFQTPAG